MPIACDVTTIVPYGDIATIPVSPPLGNYPPVPHSHNRCSSGRGVINARMRPVDFQYGMQPPLREAGTDTRVTQRRLEKDFSQGISLFVVVISPFAWSLIIISPVVR